MAKILKFTPKAHLDTETLDRMAAVAAERFRSMPSAVRNGQEPPSQMVCGLIKAFRATDTASWLYQNLTLPTDQFAEFRQIVTGAGIANSVTGGTALDALIERTVITQLETLEVVARRFGGTLFEDAGLLPSADDADAANDAEMSERVAEAARREAENSDIGELREWLEDYGWYGLMILSYERGTEAFADQSDLSEWVQQLWYGSDAFSSAPLGELDWQAANDAIFHWMEEYEFDLGCLNGIVASALVHR